LEREGETVDGVETVFGIRSIRFDENNGFFLNGKPVKIKGTCNHQDFAGIGIALPDSITAYKLEKLKNMGSNAYRCSHHPPSIELLNECDRLGLLVVDENRKLGESEEILAQVENMVLRDRNHPSVILWSLCNEEPKQGTEEARRMGDKMKQVVLKHDITRPITCAMNSGWGAGLSNVVDVQGFNYNLSQLDPYHSDHPRVPLFCSETASAVSTRGIYQTDSDKGYVSAYDVNHPEWGSTAETAWKAVIERPFIAGGFVWSGFDYRGEPTPFKWPCVNSHFGVMDTCGFPKDTYYYYQSWWTDETVLHLFPHWSWRGKEGQEINVWCHSNCDSVELFLNGNSLGSQEMPRNGHLEWKVKFCPGTLKAVGIESGRVAAEAVLETTAAPAKVRLKPQRLEMSADGEDMIPVEVEILDWKNRFVPMADNEVVFSVTGPAKIAGVGNGDPGSHEPDKANRRKAFNGRCMVLVQALKEPGEIRLSAKAIGLRHAKVFFKSVGRNEIHHHKVSRVKSKKGSRLFSKVWPTQAEAI
jgi:beta-galactosidase